MAKREDTLAQEERWRNKMMRRLGEVVSDQQYYDDDPSSELGDECYCEPQSNPIFFWVEFVCKPDALVAPVGFGGISTTALLSLVFGLANALFKVAEGVHTMAAPLATTAAST